MRRFLLLRGWQMRDLHVEKPRPGHGSGEQFVRGEFPHQLTVYRSQSRRCAICLIVCIDADSLSVEERMKSLVKACADGGVPFREPDEQVCFAVPKRNIETWLAYLRGETVDESAVYPKYDCQSRCQHDVERLDAMCRQKKSTPVPPPSLLHACEEFRRFRLHR
ncbi:MAG: hypothetical protein FJ280_05225 [Planctomycetes bacterium]|nr:hypothetical protein [Planctomycetota bacterium]